MEIINKSVELHQFFDSIYFFLDGESMYSSQIQRQDAVGNLYMTVVFYHTQLQRRVILNILNTIHTLKSHSFIIQINILSGPSAEKHLIPFLHTELTQCYDVIVVYNFRDLNVAFVLYPTAINNCSK